MDWFRAQERTFGDFGRNIAPCLRRVWEQTFGAAPPSSLSRVFLRRVLLHERQCRTHGGLSAATRRALAAMANETPSSAAPAGSRFLHKAPLDEFEVWPIRIPLLAFSSGAI